MAPVAAAISGNWSGAMKSKTQSIAWRGPAMKPSSDIDLFTTTLPFPVLVSLTLFLRSSTTHDVQPTGPRTQGRTRGACLPHAFGAKHQVTTVPEQGWAGKKNGELLELASQAFDVFGLPAVVCR